jgi:hypothetical protein
MAQFDSLIILPLLWSLIFILIAYYKLSIEFLIPSFCEVKKFREKKFSSQNFFGLILENLVTKSDQSYKSIRT